MLILFAAIGVGVGDLYYSRQPAVYSSSATMLLVQSESHLPTQLTERLVVREDPIDTHVYLLTQPVLLERAVVQGGLLKLAAFKGLTKESAARAIGARMHVVRGLVAKNVIELSYWAGDQYDVKAVLDAVTLAYLEWLKEQQGDEAKEALALIAEAKVTLEEGYKGYQTRYEKFRDETHLIFQGENAINVFEQRLADIERRRHDVVLERETLQARFNSIHESLKNGVSRDALLLVASETTVTPGKDGSASEEGKGASPFVAEIGRLMVERQTMLDKVGESHPQIKNIDSRVEALRSLLHQEAGSKEVAADTPKADLLDIHIEALKDRIQQTEMELESLDKAFAKDLTESKKLIKEQQTERAFISEGESLKAIIDAIVGKLQKLELSKTDGLLQASIMKPPSVGFQTGPDFIRYLALGGAAGVALAILLSMMLESSDKGFRTTNEISSTLGLPVIGHIPTVEPLKGQGVLKDSIADSSLAAYHRPKSRLAESYRSVRAALFFGSRGEKHRVIQVTSANPGDGKSTLAANLAIALSSSGKRTLLVDADLRRPRVHHLFGLSNDVGLSSIILGDDVPDAIRSCSIPDLHILTAGPSIESPAELLLAPRFGELLSLLREQYDFVIVDSPPLLAVTDPSAIAAHSDGVIMVVRVNKRSRPDSRRACEILQLIGARVLGVVVNGADQIGGEYGSGYGAYRNGYRAGSYDDAYYSETASKG
jgi:capsular exopolysaccharide synthesis family protein